MSVKKRVRTRLPKEERREQILAAAVRAFVRGGFHGTHVDQIIEEAGVARGTFYLYFEGKREVFETLLEEALLSLKASVRPIDVARSAPSAEGQLRAILRAVFTQALLDRDFTRLLLSLWMSPDAEVAPVVRGFYGLVTQLIAASFEKGVAKGLVRACDPALTAPAALGALQGLMGHMLLAGEAVDVDAAVDALIAFALRGVGVPARWPEARATVSARKLTRKR